MLIHRPLSLISLRQDVTSVQMQFIYGLSWPSAASRLPFIRRDNINLYLQIREVQVSLCAHSPKNSPS